MKVCLIQVDGKMPNLALMKLSKWHRDKGDEVVFVDLSTLGKFDRIYGSKIFMGGSGYNLKNKLPYEIEEVAPDYEKFNLDYSIGFTSRGCIRNCEFCIVREKEGYIHEVPTNWIEHSKVILMDNNFLASKKWKEKLQFFVDNKIKVSFNQGLDIRLLTKESASILQKVKYYDLKFKRRRLYFAFDDPKLESLIIRQVKLLNNIGIPSRHLMFYMLVGYNTTWKEDWNRYEVLVKLGCMPYIMRYHTNDKRLNQFARWVNRGYYRFISWNAYRKGNKKKKI